MKLQLADLGIAGPILLRAMIVLSPTTALAATSQDPIWLDASVMTMSTFIAYERSGLAPVGVVIHSCAISVAFTAFLFAERSAIAFVFLCALVAMAAARLTALGTKLRSVGNFTFVPALYLAMEASDAEPASSLQHLSAFLPLLLTGAIPTLILSVVMNTRDRVDGYSGPRRFLSILRAVDRAERVSDWAPAAAVAIAVLLAASVEAIFRVGHGQWVIWSAASVVTGEAATARAKLRDRCIGVIVGVPLGLLIGLLTPPNPFTYGASVIASLLTLVAFHNYLIGFSMRSMFIALAIIIANGGVTVAAERVVNVMAGGIIGLACVMGVATLQRRTSELSRPGGSDGNG